MSLVDTSTGEIVAMSERDARELIDTIKQTGDIMWRQIVRAFQGRAWVSLGYDSWDDLCDQEFGGARIKLPREERREVVASLRDAGMSTRAIAAATGVNNATVSRDLSGVADATPVHPDDDIVDGEIVEAGPIEHAPITGLDGKTYTPPTPKPAKDRRPPLTDAAERAGWELRRAIERMERIVADDRFNAHRDAISHMWRPHITFAITAIETLGGENP